MASLQGGGGNKTAAAVVAPKPKKPISAGVSGITVVPAGKSSSKPKATNYAASSSVGTNFYGGGGSSIGSTSTGKVTTAAPKAPSLSQFLLGDSAYQSQKSAIDKARADYLAQQGRDKTNYLTGYARDAAALKDNRTQAFGDLENDFAGRGLLQSGLYADNLANLTKDFDTKSSALEQAKAAYLAQLAGDLTNFTSDQNTTLTRAQQDAAARRAAQYGV